MLAFACGNCGQRLFFENSVCLRCQCPCGFVPSRLDLITLSDPDGSGEGLRRCANASLAACNWMVEADDPYALCRSCRLTRTRPADGDVEALAAFATAESAKRRLLFELLDLGLPVEDDGLRFDLLSSRLTPVVIRHSDGLITIDLPSPTTSIASSAGHSSASPTGPCSATSLTTCTSGTRSRLRRRSA